MLRTPTLLLCAALAGCAAQPPQPAPPAAPAAPALPPFAKGHLLRNTLPVAKAQVLAGLRATSGDACQSTIAVAETDAHGEFTLPGQLLGDPATAPAWRLLTVCFVLPDQHVLFGGKFMLPSNAEQALTLRCDIGSPSQRAGSPEELEQPCRAVTPAAP